MTPSSALQKERRAHASRDIDSRIAKARKIEAILSRRIDLAAKRLLDIGTGTGHIAAYFQNKGLCTVATDRQNQLADDVDIDFHQVSDVELPIDDSSIDIVLYNHVIEHVGEREQQRRHLEEIRRVLRTGGILYLAVPNRWALIEPHFKLPILSWLPSRLASLYVRVMRRGEWYDCAPFGAFEIRSLLRQVGFMVEDVTHEALVEFLSLEHGSTAVARVIRLFPQSFLKPLRPICPTLVLVGRLPSK